MPGYRHGQLGQGKQRVGGGVAGADDEGVSAGEPVPVGAEHVRQGVLEEPGGGRLAAGREAGGAEDVRDAPGAGGVDDRPGQDLLAVGEADQERGGVAAGGAQPVQAEPADRLDPGAVAHVRLELRQLGEGLQVVVDEFRAGGQGVGSGATQPASSSSRRAAGSMLYRHGENTRTCPHWRTAAPARVAGLQDEERQSALGEVRGGGQPDRAGADHDDGQIVRYSSATPLC